MSAAPEPFHSIYLQFYGDEKYWDNPGIPQKDEEITWCDTQVHTHDVKYSRADLAENLITLLLSEITRLRKQ